MVLKLVGIINSLSETALMQLQNRKQAGWEKLGADYAEGVGQLQPRVSYPGLAQGRRKQ
jgi:hypothetical protein